MSQELKENGLLEVFLRIPGPWRRSRELQSRLPEGYHFDGDRLATPVGSVELQTLPVDQEFPNIFRMSCRRPLQRKEDSGLAHYAMNVAVIARAGSMTAVQQVLKATAGLIQAGGFGVFIDNSLLAHSGSDWLELADNAHDPQAVFYAFVNLARLRDDIRSHGMHVLGQRDSVAGQDHLPSLENFLRTTCANQTDWGNGATFADQEGRQFVLKGESDRGISLNHPARNPYGRWRLEPV